MSDEDVKENEEITRSIDAVTALTVVMTIDGTVALQPTLAMDLMRQPTETDLRMLVLYLYDQLVAHPPSPQASSSEEQSLRDRLMQLLDERRSDG